MSKSEIIYRRIERSVWNSVVKAPESIRLHNGSMSHLDLFKWSIDTGIELKSKEALQSNLFVPIAIKDIKGKIRQRYNSYHLKLLTYHLSKAYEEL